jgi:hypothetical protein
MCDPETCTHMSTLRRPDHRTWRRAEQEHLLLRALHCRGRSDSGTWVIESVTGKANGSEVLSGEAIKLLNAYRTTADISIRTGMPPYLSSTADIASRGAEKTLDWVVLFGAAGFAIKARDPINLRNSFNDSQGGCWIAAMSSRDRPPKHSRFKKGAIRNTPFARTHPRTEPVSVPEAGNS